MSIRYSAPGVPGGEVSPGAGSTGFTSNSVAFANSSGQLSGTTALTFANHATSGQLIVSSTALVGLGTQTGALVIGPSNVPNMGIGTTAIQVRTSVGGGSNLSINASGGTITFGSSANSGKISLPSTVNMTSAVGGAGAAAALPATPESYIKILAPNNTGTLTTLYVPVYLSTA